MIGGGIDIWNESDQFHFVHQPVTGDTQIVARVASLQAAHEWSKAGVMIREALTGPAAHGFLFVSGCNGWLFNRRLSAGRSTDSTAGSVDAAPGVDAPGAGRQRVQRVPIEDGSQWTVAGTDTISMPATVYVGLGVTSRDAAAMATATFSNVAVTSATSSNAPPTVSLWGRRLRAHGAGHHRP